MIDVAPEQGDHKVHLVLHQPRYEVDIPRESAEPRNNEWTARRARLLESRSKVRSQQDGVFSGAGLNVLIPGCDGEAFAPPEVLYVETLSSQS